MNKSNSRMKSNIIPYNSNNIGFSSSISTKKNNSHNKHSFDISLQKTNSKSGQKYTNSNSKTIKYGERLYHKGIAYKKLIENKIQKLKKSILDKQLTQCTFHPKTLKVKVISIEKIKKNKKNNRERKSNDYNNNFQKSLSYTNINSNIEGNINSSNITKNSNINVIKKNKNNLSIPKPNSNIIKKKKVNSYNVSLKLYNDNKILKQKRKEEIDKFFKTNYPFKPRISKSQETVPAKNSFFSRLQNWINNQSIKQLQLREELLYDSQTGLRLFSPNILHTTYSNSQFFSSKQKCLKLFDESKLRKKKIQIAITELNENIYRMANSTFFSPRSRVIIDNLMKKIFRKIFKMISLNGNFIDNNNINLENIDINLLEIFIPLFQEIDNNNDILNEDDFVESSFNLYNEMSIYQKNILLEWYFNILKTENHKRQYINHVKNNSFKNDNFHNLIIQTDSNSIINNRNNTNNTIFTNDLITNNDFFNNSTTNLTQGNNEKIINLNQNEIVKKEKEKIKNKETINNNVCTFRPLSNESTSRLSKNIELNSPSTNNNKIIEKEDKIIEE